jgi:ketosteroid isomerase-like protein
MRLSTVALLVSGFLLATEVSPVRARAAQGREDCGDESSAQSGQGSAKPGVATSVADLRRIVEQGHRQAVEAFKKGAMLTVARGYADDGVIFIPGGKSARGREAIDRYWLGIKKPKDWKLEVVEVGGTREAIYEVGKSSLTSEVNGKDRTYVCDFVLIWKRQKDGSYRIHTDINN